jgi:hypothetical protein
MLSFGRPTKIAVKGESVVKVMGATQAMRPLTASCGRYHGESGAVIPAFVGENALWVEIDRRHFVDCRFVRFCGLFALCRRWR